MEGGQPTRSGPAWGLDGGLTTPNH